MPTTGLINAPTSSPTSTTVDTLPETPLAEFPDTGESPVEPSEATGAPPLGTHPGNLTTEAKNITADVEGEHGGGGAEGRANPDGGIEMPHKKSGGQGSGHQGIFNLVAQGS